jgi:hypothetical protein
MVFLKVKRNFKQKQNRISRSKMSHENLFMFASTVFDFCVNFFCAFLQYYKNCGSVRKSTFIYHGRTRKTKYDLERIFEFRPRNYIVRHWQKHTFLFLILSLGDKGHSYKVTSQVLNQCVNAIYFEYGHLIKVKSENKVEPFYFEHRNKKTFRTFRT